MVESGPIWACLIGRWYDYIFDQECGAFLTAIKKAFLQASMNDIVIFRAQTAYGYSMV